MIVKISDLSNTNYVKRCLRIVSMEEMDIPLPWELDPVVVRLLEESETKYCLCDATGQIAHSQVYGVATTDDDTNEPAVLLFITRDSHLDVLLDVIDHEAIHVQQFKDGRLSFKGDRIVWLGEVQDSIDIPAITEDATLEEKAAYQIIIMQYYSQPWEFEAINGRWDVLFGKVCWPYDIIEKYGTLWPSHWDRDHVHSRLVSADKFTTAIKALLEEGY